MKQGQTILLVLLTVAAVAALLAFAWPEEREPVYQGKTLTDWLVDYYRNKAWSNPAEVAATQRASNAVHHIGAKAVPFLVRWLDDPPPPWRQQLAFQTWSRLPRAFKRPGVEGTLAGKRAIQTAVAGGGFEILREQAAPAVPELTRIAGKLDRGGFAALAALGCVGKAGLPPLVATLTNQNFPPIYHSLAAQAIGDAGPALGTNASWAVPVLVACLQDTNWMVTYRAAYALGRLHLEPALAVPALAKSLHANDDLTRRNSAEALRQFGAEAGLAVPDLLALSRRAQNAAERQVASNTLQTIAPQTLQRNGPTLEVKGGKP